MNPSVNNFVEQPPLSEAAFIAGFHAIGEERYHHKHPFHALMHEGRLIAEGSFEEVANHAVVLEAYLGR